MLTPSYDLRALSLRASDAYERRSPATQSNEIGFAYLRYSLDYNKVCAADRSVICENYDSTSQMAHGSTMIMKFIYQGAWCESG